MRINVPRLECVSLFNGVRIQRFIDDVHIAVRIVLDIVHPYVHTFRDTGIPIDVDTRSANMRATVK